MAKSTSSYIVFKLLSPQQKYEYYHCTSRGNKGIEEAAKRQRLNGWEFELTDYKFPNQSQAQKKCNELNQGITVGSSIEGGKMRQIMKEHKGNFNKPLSIEEIDKFILRLEHGLNYYKKMKEGILNGEKDR